MIRTITITITLFVATIAVAQSETIPTDQKKFAEHIQPLLTKFCADCHGEKKQKADFFLHDIDGAITGGKDTVRWEKILEMVSLGDMPPEDKPQLSKLERAQLTTWVAAELRKIGRGQDTGKLALPSDHRAVFAKLVIPPTDQ